MEAAAAKTTALAAAMRLLSDTTNVARAAFDVLSGAWNFASGFVEAGAQVERFRVQFGGLLGDYGKADAALAKLRTYSNSSPLQFNNVVEAARQLYTITDGLSATQGGMEGTIELLKKVGDSLPNAGALNEVTLSIGRVFNAVRTGVDFQEPIRALANQGVVTTGLVTTLERMNRQGATFAEQWARVTKDIERGAGNAERFSFTYEGMISNLSDSWSTLKASLGEPLAIALKAPIQDLTNFFSDRTGAVGQFGEALSRQVRVFYGAFRLGELPNYLSAEFDRATTYLSAKWSEWSTWAGEQVKKYVTDPLAAADFDGALSQVATNLGTALKAAFDDGVSSFRAGMSVAIGQMEQMLAATLTAAFSGLPASLGGGRTITPSASSLRTYGEFKQEYSERDTKAPANILAPLTDSAGKATRALLGLSDAESGYGASFATIGRGAAAGRSSIMAPGQDANGLPAGGGEVSNALFGGTVVGVAPAAADAAMQRARITFYTAFEDRYASQTATGVRAQQGVTAAVDPKLIPYGSSLEIPALAAMNGNGVFTAQDTGTAVKNRQASSGGAPVIDIYLDAANAEDSRQKIAAASAKYGEYADIRLAGGTGSKAGGAEGLASNEDRYLKAGTVTMPGAGKGLVEQTTAATRAYDDAMKVLGSYGYKIEEVGEAQTGYNKSVAALGTLFTQGRISQGAYTAEMSKAQQKLLQSNAAYQEIAGSIGKAAAEQANWNRISKEATGKMGTDTYGSGNSFAFGMQDAAHRQGTSDQQFAKLGGDVYSQLGQSFTSVADSFVDNNGRMQQSFGQMTAQLLKDIAKLIINMLILKAVQTLIGGAFGGSGSFLTTPSSGVGSGIFGGTAHTGGVIGQTALPTREYPAWVFAGAPRLHGGGYLAPGEVPAILQTGEMVLSRAQVQGMASAPRGPGGAGGQIAYSPTYNVSTSGGDKDNGPGITEEQMRAIDKRMRSNFQDEIRRATKYRGALNPG